MNPNHEQSRVNTTFSSRAGDREVFCVKRNLKKKTFTNAYTKQMKIAK